MEFLDTIFSFAKKVIFGSYTNSSPANGEVWYDGTDMCFRLGGTTYKIPTSGTPLAVGYGGTGATSANAALNALLPSQTGNSGEYLTTDGTTTSWGAVSVTDVTTAIGGSIVKYKSADESITSSSVLQDDDHLTVTLPASATYLVIGELFNYSTAGNCNIKIKFVVPSSGSFLGQLGANFTNGTASYTNDLTSTWGVSGSTATSRLPTNGMFAGIMTSGSGGTFKLQWAQQSSSANTSTVYKHSYMKLVRIA